MTKYFDEGVAFSNKNENDKAIEKFTEVIKLKPSYALAYNWRGYVYQKKEYDIAINDQKKLFALHLIMRVIIIFRAGLLLQEKI